MKQFGKYVIHEQLGEGGMGVVYKGRDPVIDRPVAIKVLHERVIENETSRERFFREARSAGRLMHPNITVVHDVGEMDGTPFIVMEYLDGTDLRELIDNGHPFTLTEKLSIARQIAQGLLYAHEHGVVHRDVKPANIHVLPDGTVKVMDFGIARLHNEGPGLTATNTGIGTPGYMAPEQIESSDVDHRADIFSYGVLLYELLTGVQPFKADYITAVIYNIMHTDPPPVKVDPDMLSAPLHQLVSECIKKEAALRYGSFVDVLRDLSALAEAEKDPATAWTLPVMRPRQLVRDAAPTARSERATAGSPTQPVEESAPPKRRRTWLWVTLGLFAVAAAAVGGAIGMGYLDVSALFGPTRVAAMSVEPGELRIALGNSKPLNIEYRDRSNNIIVPEDHPAHRITWVTEDTAIARVAPLPGEMLNVTVLGRTPGNTNVTARIGDVTRFISVEVYVPQEVLSSAEQDFLQAVAALGDSTQSDSTLFVRLQGVQATYRYALSDDNKRVLDERLAMLQTAIDAFERAKAVDAADSLSINEKQAVWRSVAQSAGRASPSTRMARERLAALEAVRENAAGFEDGSFVICDRTRSGGSSGQLQLCVDRAVADTFAVGASITFNAGVDAPRSTTLRWDWVDPSGEAAKSNRASVPAVAGYRIWDVLTGGDTATAGRYQLRMYDGELMIERKVFVLR